MDFYTDKHAQRMGLLIEKLGMAAGFSKSKIKSLKLFARFHDIGKAYISDQILFKPGPLSSDEVAEMQKHSIIGFQIAQSLVVVADWILKHHEQWDGKGYPLGLKGQEIPIECRIIAIIDAYDAMTNDRPYRKAMSHNDAINELQRHSGTQFDPNLVDTFLKLMNNKCDIEKIG